MSHSLHGECDVDSQRTGETTGSQQLAGRADDVGSCGHADGCQHPAYETHAGGLSGEGGCRDCHGHRGRRAPNATPDAVAYDVVHLARARYAGANHTHLSELLNEREGIDIGRTTLRRILVNAELRRVCTRDQYGREFPCYSYLRFGRSVWRSTTYRPALRPGARRAPPPIAP